MTVLASYIENVSAVRNMEEIVPLHCETMETFGFDRILYGMTRSRDTGSLGNRDDFLILTNLSSEYTGSFVEEGLFRVSPMLPWVLNNTGAMSWNWMMDRLANGELTDREIEVMEFNKKHQVTAGYSISFLKLTPRSIAAIALIAKPGTPQEQVEEVWAEHGRIITAMNNVFHLKATQLPYTARNAAGKMLTKRQRQVLEWVGDGKTTLDTATIMGLTPATVEKHLRLAREALDVETTPQAVVKASFQNQIFLISDLDEIED